MWNKRRMDAFGEAMLPAFNEPECAGKKKQIDALVKHAQKKGAADSIDPDDIPSLEKSGPVTEFAREATKSVFGSIRTILPIINGTTNHENHYNNH